MTQLKGGLTNLLYKCSSEISGYGGYHSVLVKIFGEGTGLFIDREHEKKIVKYLNSKRLSDAGLGFFTNGRVDPFIDAEVLPLESMSKPSVMKEIGRMMKDLHYSVSLPGQRDPILWRHLDLWINQALTMRFEHGSLEADQLATLKLNAVIDEIAWLKKKLAPLNSPIGKGFVIPLIDTTVLNGL